MKKKLAFIKKTRAWQSVFNPPTPGEKITEDSPEEG
jgi:hypothetical protein